MSSVIRNGVEPHQNKEAATTKVFTLGRLHDHAWAAGLPEGATIHKLDDGRVVVRVPPATRLDAKGKTVADGPDYSEVTVSSSNDDAHRARGAALWYDALLAEAEASKKAK